MSCDGRDSCPRGTRSILNLKGMDVLQAHGEEKAVVLVAHGLNLRAHALRDLYEPLRERGATIVVLDLTSMRVSAASTRSRANRG